MSKEQLKVGILGTGFMGQTHGKRLAADKHASIVGICDTVVASGRALKESLGVDAAVFDNFDAMLDSCAMDALYVCLPPFAHSGQVEKAAAKGIHLFLEKPIAADVDAARSMVEAIEKAGVVTQVGFHMRFRTSVSKLKQMLDDGSAGRPTMFTGRFWCNMLGKDWWRRKDGSGGQVYEQLIHLYDLALYLLGQPDTVCGFMDNLTHTDIREYTIEDTSIGTIRFANGSLAAITGSNCALPEHYIGDCRLVCEKLLFDYVSTGDWRVTETAALHRHGDGETAREDVTEDGDPFLAETEDFLRVVRQGGTTRTPVQDGLAAVRLVSAMMESAENNGEPVRL